MPTSPGPTKLQSFAPNWGDPQVLEKTLVGRKDLVDRLETLALDGARGGALHQRLIVGPRGSGKTHVMRVLHNRLRANEDLRGKLLLIYLLEDELGVATCLDFIVRMLRAILRWSPEQEELRRSLGELAELPPDVQQHRAVQLLLDVVGDNRALVLMENLGVTFDKKAGFGRPGQQALRDLLQQHPRFMIFATSQALVEGTRDRKAPFHAFFQVTHLPRLTREDAGRFVSALADAYGEQDVAAFLASPEGQARISACYDFTGGNHRLLVTFYEFLGESSVARLSEIFIKRLNPLRPYYQEQMRSLSAQQQKIVQYLSIERSPRTVKQIARGCLAAETTISSQLKDLLDRNLVSRERRGRASYYEVTEALFRIIYQADLEQEGAPVRLFIDFLGHYYTGQELLRRHRGYRLLGQLGGGSSTDSFHGEAALYEQAISACHPELAPKLGAAVKSQARMRDLHLFFQDLRQAGAYREILEFSKHLREGKDAAILRSEAFAYTGLGRRTEGLEAAERATQLDPASVDAHLTFGFLLSADGRHTEALGHFEKLQRLRPESSAGWRWAGQVRQLLGQFEHARRDLKIATERDSDDAVAWASLASVQEALGEVEEGQRSFSRALSVGEPATNLYNFRGEARRTRRDFEGALDDYRTALDADPSAILPQFNMLTAYLSLGNVQAAADSAKLAVEAAASRQTPAGPVVQCIRENLLALFEAAPPQAWPSFMQSYLGALKEQGLLELFEQALAQTVFDLVRRHAEVAKDRLVRVMEHLRTDLSAWVEVSVAVRFLEVGVAHFQDGDPTALLRLAREERQVFCRELGIDREGLGGAPSKTGR